MRIDDSFIIFDEDKHSYTDIHGNAYLSVSALLKKVTPEFPREAISRAVAKRDGKTQQEVLKEWDQLRDSAIVRGNAIHNALEHYAKTEKVLESNWEQMIKSVMGIYDIYEKVYAEKRLYYVKGLICGTTDKMCYRGSNIMDYNDYKTNERNGIQYTSKYNKFLLDPVSHLEDCNYNKYALQISTYAYIGEKQFGYKAGRLSLTFIPPDNVNNWQRIPVPYMRAEVKNIVDWYMESDEFKATPAPIQDSPWS